MLPEMKHLIETLEPDVLWSDGDWEASPDYFGSKEFLAWLYNDSPSKSRIVTNDRWGIGTRMKHGGFYSGPDHFSPGVLQPHKWENCMTVDKKSWTNRRNIKVEDVHTPQELIHEVVKTVSCGGNILLNVGPNRDGMIIPIFAERLKQLGSWLNVNGEAIYASKPWRFQNDTLNPNVWYTSKDNDVYAIVIGWPNNDELVIEAPKFYKKKLPMTMLGYSGPIDYKQEGSKLKIQFPSMSRLLEQCPEGCQWAYTLKFENPSQFLLNNIGVDIMN